MTRLRSTLAITFFTSAIFKGSGYPYVAKGLIERSSPPIDTHPFNSDIRFCVENKTGICFAPIPSAPASRIEVDNACLEYIFYFVDDITRSRKEEEEELFLS